MHWDVVWNNLDYFLWGAYPKGPLGGLAMSIVLALLGIFGAFWIGLVAGLMRLSRKKWLHLPAVVYIEVVRGTPLLMVIFWFYFLAPILLNQTLPAAESALTSFIIFTGAYVAEIVRAGVLSLPKGQMEAARGSQRTACILADGRNPVGRQGARVGGVVTEHVEPARGRVEPVQAP